ncbi:GGDEF domain-containing protein [Clostridium aminobutyricum]|uniref:EAL domain-containing protein n=1 Tax=Clostridium aminobutyricum TaxID=33953 RepID=A0A939IFU9_CLOAM|nr:diguanylate cyclase [Clostridium aminobutyricum]MBN7771940.1 EAL domain-containing protein [Clostridium aminobutyricum]
MRQKLSQSITTRFIFLISIQVITEALLFAVLLSKFDLSFSHSNSSVNICIAIAAVTLISFTVSLLMTGLLFIRPVKTLSNNVRERDPMKLASLGRTNITELDLLAGTIESLSANVADSSSKMSNILDVAGKRMAIYEYYQASSQVYITKHLFLLLEEPDLSLHITGFIPSNVFDAKMAKLEKFLVPSQSTKNNLVFHLDKPFSTSKWIRMITIHSENQILGVLEDITDEMLAKNKMEFERDYDILTGLLNRRAFFANVEKLFSSPEQIGIGAMFSLDLDNLKKMNDTYGHHYGDEYIRALSNVLNVTCRKNTIISRLGGDEFALFMHGFSSKEEIRSEIVRLSIAIHNHSFNLPDETSTELRASAGVAWYPDDSTSYLQLIKYSDFAMYSVKKTTKGVFAEFNLKDYEKDSHFTEMSEHFEEFIKHKTYEYHFQPILDANTGNIFGYEALLRSNHSVIKTPRQLLELAASPSQLYEIEKITWFAGIKAFNDLNVAPSSKLFINSIPEQQLSVSDTSALERTYCHMLNRVIVELDYGGGANAKYTKAKQDFIRNWGGEIALGDYGTGSYNEDMMKDIAPKYIKIDLSITQNLTRDENKRKLIKSIVTYAHQRNAFVIAEGVERQEDMFALIDIGVDYLQGFYICKPSKKPPLDFTIIKSQITNYKRQQALKTTNENA